MTNSRIPHRLVKRCVFCPNKAESREHAWSDWVLNRLGTHPNRRVYGRVGDVAIGPDPHRKAIRVRCVCVPCNTGWMKAMEDAVIPTAGAMMSDLSISLDVSQQAAIAVWAVKTAMVFEYLTKESREIFYSDEHRAALRTSLMPPYTAVWLARYAGRAKLFAWGNDVRTGPTGNMNVQGYVATFAYQTLAIQVLSMWAGPN